jgi:uncharacterized membrane protein YphA (DoxX/SURF4 family)
MKTTKNLYWIFTILFSLLLLMDAIGGITRQQGGQDVMRHLGFPMYLLSIVGIAKLLAVVAMVQTRFVAIKEWAFAGITINFIGAFASRAFVGDGVFETIFPLIMLALFLAPYFLWKRLLKAQMVKHP